MQSRIEKNLNDDSYVIGVSSNWIDKEFYYVSIQIMKNNIFYCEVFYQTKRICQDSLPLKYNVAVKKHGNFLYIKDKLKNISDIRRYIINMILNEKNF